MCEYIQNKKLVYLLMAVIKSMITMEMKFYPRTFFVIVLAFVGFTVVGTLSHEYGHIIVAKANGFDTKLHYGSMSYDNSGKLKEYWDIYKGHKEEIENGVFFDGKPAFEKMEKELTNASHWVTWGGPLQTMIVGTIGLLLLWFRSAKRKGEGFKTLDWIGVFLSLFWLRQIANLLYGVVAYLLFGREHMFGGDEAKLAIGLHLPSGVFAITFGVLGALVGAFIVFVIVPKRLRLTFISGGLVGGVTGFILWLHILGPVVLP